MNVLHVEGRYLGYITDKDSVNMTGLYMLSQFILFSISRLAILKFKSEYKSVLNIWFLGIIGHFLFSFSLPITRLTKYFEYFLILIMPYTDVYKRQIHMIITILMIDSKVFQLVAIQR